MSYSIIMGIVRLLIRVVTFWNNILAESSKSPAKQLFGVEMRSEADYEYLLDLNQVNSLWRLWKGIRFSL